MKLFRCLTGVHNWETKASQINPDTFKPFGHNLTNVLQICQKCNKIAVTTIAAEWDFNPLNTKSLT